MKTDMDKIKISSIPVLIFCYYILSVILVESFDLICFLCGLKQKMIISRLCIAAILYLCILKGRKLFSIDQRQISRSRIFFLTVIFFLGFIKSLFPDTGYDTMNYHLIAQQPGFVNYMQDGIGTGNFQIWGFRLGDRLFYLFREAFGYRLGTVFNTLIIMLIFYQISLILDHLGCSLTFESVKNKFLRNLLKLCFGADLFSFIIILGHSILMLMGTYYVDLVAIPLCLELVYIILFRNRQNKNELLFFAFLSGVILAVKLTNIIFVAPCLIIYLFIQRKNMNLKLWVYGCGIAVFPCAIYMIYNYACTLNPFYPYYNKIFKSPYFEITNWKDGRFGPTNFVEMIYWPFSIAFSPQYRLSEIVNKYTLFLKAGVIVLLALIIYGIIRKFRKQQNDKKIIILIVLFISSMYLWAFTTGIERYAITGCILLEILVFAVIHKILCKPELIKFVCILFLLCAIGIESVKEVNEVFRKGNEWSWRPVNRSSLKREINYAFRDRVMKYGDAEIMYLYTSSQGGYAQLLSDEGNMVFEEYINNISDENIKSEAKDKLNQKLSESQKVYGLFVPVENSWEDYISYLNKYGMKIESITPADIKGISDIRLVKLRRTSTENCNALYYMDGDEFTAINQGKKGNALEATIFMRWSWWEEGYISADITMCNNETGEKKKIWSDFVPNNQYEKISVNICESDDLDHCSFIVQAYYPDGSVYKRGDSNDFYLLNPEIIYK